MKHDFPYITENLALNFCNTIILKQGKRVDLFPTVDSFKLWLEIPIDKNENYNRQLSAMYSCLDIDIELEEIKILREEITNLLVKIINNTDAIDDIKITIESFTRNSPFTIIFIGNNPIMIPVEKGIKGMKTLLFLSLSSLIQSEETKKLVKCANKECRLFFINQSGRRKWCSMKLCGNRNKVEKYLNKTRNNQN